MEEQMPCKPPPPPPVSNTHTHVTVPHLQIDGGLEGHGPGHTGQGTHAQGLVLPVAVAQQAVDGAVMVVSLRLQRLSGEAGGWGEPVKCCA